jgi:hypothetical protein
MLGLTPKLTWRYIHMKHDSSDVSMFLEMNVE